MQPRDISLETNFLIGYYDTRVNDVQQQKKDCQWQFCPIWIWNKQKLIPIFSRQYFRGLELIRSVISSLSTWNIDRIRD